MYCRAALRRFRTDLQIGTIQGRQECKNHLRTVQYTYRCIINTRKRRGIGQSLSQAPDDKMAGRKSTLRVFVAILLFATYLVYVWKSAEKLRKGQVTHPKK